MTEFNCSPTHPDHTIERTFFVYIMTNNLMSRTNKKTYTGIINQKKIIKYEWVLQSIPNSLDKRHVVIAVSVCTYIQNIIATYLTEHILPTIVKHSLGYRFVRCHSIVSYYSNFHSHNASVWLATFVSRNGQLLLPFYGSRSPSIPNPNVHSMCAATCCVSIIRVCLRTSVIGWGSDAEQWSNWDTSTSSIVCWQTARHPHRFTHKKIIANKCPSPPTTDRTHRFQFSTIFCNIVDGIALRRICCPEPNPLSQLCTYVVGRLTKSLCVDNVEHK